MKQVSDIYQKVTDQIIRQIETGAGKFNMPWHGGTFIPSNVSRKTQYRGVNILHLWSEAKLKGYASHLWGTRSQWNKLDARIRRGERATQVVYCNFGEDVDEHHVRMWPVFNVAQIRGYEVPVTQILPETERISKAERCFRRVGADVRFGGDAAPRG